MLLEVIKIIENHDINIMGCRMNNLLCCQKVIVNVNNALSFIYISQLILNQSIDY